MLCNENERAWYDSHREGYLRGGDKNGEPGEARDDDFDFQPYMAANAFTDFTDGPKGFYTVIHQQTQRYAH